MAPSSPLPADARAQQGGLLFLASLLVFFLTGIVTYVLVASWRPNDFLQSERLPMSFAVSTLCLVLVSASLHLALSSIRRERRRLTLALLALSLVGAIVFIAVQGQAMWQIGYDALEHGLQAGLAGMILALALLHALHVIGGIAALAIVTMRTVRGQYDHERHWGLGFTGMYWHFLDVVWLCMLAAFWYTTGGFA